MIEPQGASSAPHNLGVLSSTHAVEAEEQRLKVTFGSLAWALSQKVKGEGGRDVEGKRGEIQWLSFVCLILGKLSGFFVSRNLK